MDKPVVVIGGGIVGTWLSAMSRVVDREPDGVSVGVTCASTDYLLEVRATPHIRAGALSKMKGVPGVKGRTSVESLMLPRQRIALPKSCLFDASLSVF